MDNWFAITWNELVRDEIFSEQTLWKAETPEQAVETFRASFDEVDIKKVSNVKVYKLVEVVIF